MPPVLIARHLVILVAGAGLVAFARAPFASDGRSESRVHAGVSPPADSATRSIGFGAEFSGLGTTHTRLVWQGRTLGTPGNNVTMTVEPLCTPLASAEPVWPIRVRWSESGSGTVAVAVAELEGIVDWKRNRLHVDGMVLEGRLKGRQVTLHATFQNLDPVGVLSVANPRTLANRADAGGIPTLELSLSMPRQVASDRQRPGREVSVGKNAIHKAESLRLGGPDADAGGE
jgi:hypothetical protein